MVDVEKNLAKDESIISRAVTSNIAALPRIIGAVIVFILFSMGGGAMILIGLIVAAIMIGLKLMTINAISLVLTNKKMVGHYGIINTKTMDAPLNKLNSVAVDQNLFGKIFGYATINVTTSSGGYEFRYIKDADVFRTAVMNQIDIADEERVRRQAELLAGAVKQ